MPGNNAPLLSDNSPRAPRRAPAILHNPGPGVSFDAMKRTLMLTVLLLGMALAGQASAQCFADYKAKQDNPLRLQYGIVELPAEACGSPQAAADYAAAVIARSGWTLLQIESIFDASEFQRRSGHAGAIHRRQ